MKERLTIFGIEEMDGIHRQELEFLDALIAAIDEEESSDELISARFEMLLEDMRRHFDFEEELMRNHGFGMYNIHKSDHDKTINEVRYQFGIWRSTRDRLRVRDYFAYEFAEWLPRHIDAMDSVLADFLKGRS